MKSFVLAMGIGLLLGVTAAGAADLYEPQPAPQPYAEPAPAADASGWYLRGDVGYTFNESRGGYYFPGGAYKSFDSVDLDNAWSLGGGIGYQINRYLRTDFTADYSFDSGFKGHSVCGAGCYSNDTANLHMLSLLANAYVDLGTWYRVTPYVGAGIGGTYVDFGKFTSATHCGGGAACGGGAFDSSFDYDGRSDWRFTYALMAGASVDITCNLKFDAGYRFRRVSGGGVSDDIVDPSSGNAYGRSYDKGMNIHEVRGGLRYTFGGCAQPAPNFVSYEPAPVYK
ncbi:MAG: outer membrane protein [Pararhizobium sp.]